MPRRHYRTYFLKTRFLADQYAKGTIFCEYDYFISAIHSKTALQSGENQIDGIVYPSVQYLHKGFNYAFPPRLFEDGSFELHDVYYVKAKFEKDIWKYPKWEILNQSQNFDGDNILWS